MSSSTYVTAAYVHKLRLSLTERDWDVIRTLRSVRLGSSQQLQTLHYAGVSTRRARASLTALAGKRVLATIPGSVGGAQAGSKGRVYGLDVAGARLAGIDAGARGVRPWGRGKAFLAHTLAVTDLYVALTTATRQTDLELMSFTGEPLCWRPIPGPLQPNVIKPDAHLIVRTHGYTDHWFVEIDMGTEAPVVVARKCQVYRRYWLSGSEQVRTGLFPLVLWLAPDEARVAQLRSAISKLPVEARQLFVVALQSEATARLKQGAA
ncbi:MAG: replication-relaxation family protein [Kineosporiaceae bacterium]|nr:replication-relaxation family protein [Kineosporiaceae bacterium]